jgi:transcriptional regulator with GAF, ATPase, and Fis domain
LGDTLRAAPRLVAAASRESVGRHRLVILVAALLVCGYSAAVIGYVRSSPEIGIRCAFTPVVNHFYEDFVFPRGADPLRPGDRIVSLAGRPVQNWSQLLHTLNALRQTTPTAVSLSELRDPQTAPYVQVDDGPQVVRVNYERDGKAGQSWCRLGPSPVETLVPSILWFFLKVGLFVVGALVFWKRPGDRSAAQFFLLCIVTVGAYMGGYHWSRIVTEPALIVVFIVCSVLLPPVSLHFYLVFPRPKAILDRRPRTVLLAIYGPPLVFLFLLLSGYLRVRWFNHEGLTGAVERLLAEMLLEIFCYFGLAALWYLACVVSLIHSYFTAANSLERNQVKWILLGSAVATFPIGWTLYLAFADTAKFGGGGGTWPMFAASACVTAAFTVSITRYRLMQLDQLLSSGVIYFLISTVVGLVYYGIVFVGMVLVGTRAGEGPPLGHVLAVSSTALILMVALDLARARFTAALRRHFHREKYQLDRTLRQMSQTIDRLVDPATLAHRLLHTSAELLGAARGAVYLRYGDPPIYRLSDTLGPAPALAELPPGCPLVEALDRRGVVSLSPASRSLRLPPGPPVGDLAGRQLRFLGGELAHTLLHEGRMLGMLVLGPRDGAPYTPEEFNLLAAFTQVGVLALVSAEGHRTIEALNRDLKSKVEKIAEQQRRILALQSQLMSRATRAASAQPDDPSTDPPPAGREPADGVVGSSPQVHQLMHLVRKVAASSSVVLLRGESGTGKEVLARAVHEHGPRAGKPFVKVHCAALSPTLLESELFGHVKGAFTNAIRDKVGRFEAAHGGTLFLDEIGDVSPDVQVKLLRVLQEMTFERVGSSEPVRVDVRVIAATHQDLEALIRQARFREDLYYRLNVLPITLPPLRERAEDIPELVQHFLRLYARRCGKDVTAIDDDALACLKACPWPGNIRQLENVIERAVVVAEKLVLGIEDLPPDVRGEAILPASAADGQSPESVWEGSLVEAERRQRDRREREQLVRALAAAGGNKAEAARALGMARSTLLSRMKRLGLS